ncbi:hypothetical protein BDW74DRAFT_152772 [Aspergillus multicolor]|uniref:uncharacterized protein n=1 Tax=Aspergillus multicolor TaxID=41759 RepID=UPI003CCD02B7
MALKSNFRNVKLDEEDEFICQCGFRMKDFSVKKKPSPYYGLEFYACAKHSADATRCESKIWSDEKERVRSLIPAAMRSPRTPRKQVDIRIFGQYTAPSTLKRQAETESFDSAVGGMMDNEPISPSISRSVKRVRFAYVDAATQTGETRTAPASAARRPASRQMARPAPTARPMPRRRLFEEYLGAPKSQPAAKFDPFASRALGPNISDQHLSVPASSAGGRPRQSFTSLKPPEAVPRVSKANAATSFNNDYYRNTAPQAKEPTTPPNIENNKTGLFTPPTGNCCQTAHPPPPTEDDDPAPGTPTKSKHSSVSASRPQRDTTPPNSDSDEEEYGWDNNLNQNILEVVEIVENPRASPLFV